MTDEMQSLKNALGQSVPLSDGLYANIPEGWKFEPLYMHCPKCGCDLNKEFVPAETNEGNTNSIKSHANRFGVAGMAGNFPGRHVEAGRNNSRYQGMVYPLAKTNEKRAKRNQGRRDCGVSLEQTRSSKKENDNADNHEDLIPMVKGKFGKRIFQWFHRLVS
jgi:hypothetical protein